MNSKMLFFFLFSIFIFPISGHTKTQQKQSAFCVQNFNAYGPAYAVFIKKRTAKWSYELLNKDQCDVIQLQEVWNRSHINQVKNYFTQDFELSSPNKDERIGVMSLFQGNILAEETHTFEENSDGGPLDRVRDRFNVKKAFHIVTARLPEVEDEIYFINTHLHPSSMQVRLTQVLDILEWRLENQDLKFILSGDFNSDPNTLEIKLVKLLLGSKDSMEEVLGGYPNNYCTYCSKNILGWLLKDHIFDYIFYSNIGSSHTVLLPKEGKVNLTGTRLKPYSDHYGIQVIFSETTNSLHSFQESYEERVKELQDVLRRSKLVLKANKKNKFQKQIDRLTEIEEELQSQSGKFYDYFMRYFLSL